MWEVGLRSMNSFVFSRRRTTFVGPLHLLDLGRFLLWLSPFFPGLSRV